MLPIESVEQEYDCVFGFGITFQPLTYFKPILPAQYYIKDNKIRFFLLITDWA